MFYQGTISKHCRCARARRARDARRRGAPRGGAQLPELLQDECAEHDAARAQDHRRGTDLRAGRAERGERCVATLHQGILFPVAPGVSLSYTEKEETYMLAF